MSDILEVKYEGAFGYNIFFEQSFNRLFEEIKSFGVVNKRLCIITESNVGPLYAKELQMGFANCCKEVYVFTIPAGEASKNLDFIADMYEFLIQNHFDRNDMLVALGGGVIGDMTGFCAATYLRGIDFIQIPTSLLAQVDSSVGGKTGVDFRGYKNMVGAFKQPKMVYMNLSTLKTLKEREFLSGMGEVIKYGFIMDRDFLGWLGEHESQIKSLDYDALEYMVKKSCDFKRKVVEIDPKETLGERAKLNLGHTLGHAIEKSLDFGLLHGECVALGMVTSLLISMSKGYISPKEVKEGVQLIAKFNLPVQLPDSFALDVDKVIEITKSDKKMDSGVVKFVLLKEIGEAVVEKTVTLCDMATALETIMK